MKTCINPKLYKLTLEKMVIGVEEPVLVKGIGELVAKVDSGNSGYNVIHGEDIVIQGNIINFKTFNKNGDERRVSKKIKDTIKINIGGGHIQDRPVVELDVQFGGEDYKKVPFSITNRSDNEHKILISKDFVGNELEALIDVTKDNISNDRVNVDYVTEGVFNTLKKINNKVGEWADKTEALKKDALGEYQHLKTYDDYKVSQKIQDEVNGIENLKKQLNSDAELIRNQLPSQTEKLDTLEVPVTKDNIKVFKILDYTGGTNIEGKNANPEYKELIKKALKRLKKLGQKQAKNLSTSKKVNEKEEFITEDTAQLQQNNQQLQSAAQNDKENNNPGDPNKLIQGQEGVNDINDMEMSEVEEIFNDLASRNRAIFYMINFEKDNSGNELLFGEKAVEKIQATIDNWTIKIAQGKDWSFNAFKNLGEAIAKEFITNNPRGLFAYCSGVSKGRSVEYVTSALFPSGGITKESANKNKDIISEFIEEYNQLNAEYQELGGKGDISEEGINSLLQGGEQPQNEMSAFIEEYNNLNNEYLQIADSMGQSGDNINEQDILALIELAQESAQNKQSSELGQTDQGDMHDKINYGYHTETESEERKIK